MIQKTYSFSVQGQTADVYSFQNKNGCQMTVSTLGARILTLLTPDKKGHLDDIIVGLARPEDYIDEHIYHGATIGRYGNRIGNAQFTLNGITYHTTGGKHTLHGGDYGFESKIFKATINGDALEMTYVSPDGEEGFPGELTLTVSMALRDDDTLDIHYHATTTKDTVCNFTNHAYFNLGTEDTILNEMLCIQASRITPCDDDLIPDGHYMDVANTPFSFLTPTTFRTNMFSKEHLIDLCGGFDFNYCLDRKTAHELEYLMEAYDPKTGRVLECATTLPGVQLYTANKMELHGKKEYGAHSAFCLETQCYPNSPNCENYPTTTLRAGEVYDEETIYRFSVR